MLLRALDHVGLSHAKDVSVSQMRLDLNFSTQLVLHAGLGQLFLRKHLVKNAAWPGEAHPRQRNLWVKARVGGAGGILPYTGQMTIYL